MDKGAILLRMDKLLEQYFSLTKEEFIPGKTRIPLSVPSYGFQEVSEALRSLMTTWVTMGEKVEEFEKIFANYIGVKYAVMVNSGSSANLLALSVLTNPALNCKLKPGDEVITPAVTWPTTVYPIVNVGAIPVFVDVDLDSYNISCERLNDALSSKTRAIMPVHLLGNPCDMDRIVEFVNDNDLFLIEDACEAHGAEYKGRKVGGFGNLSTFSFFLSHHITTVEGGMVLTNNEDYYEIAKALRAFGWIRNLSNRKNIAKKYSRIDSRFLFINLGYNFRPTEMQGGFGLHQIKKLNEFIRIRRDNASYWTHNLGKYSEYMQLPSEQIGAKHVYFGYPIVIKKGAPFTREEITRFLESRKIETRPIMAGNITEQPVSKLFRHRIIGKLVNSRDIMRYAFFIGNHHAIGKEQREYVLQCMSEFIDSRKSKNKTF